MTEASALTLEQEPRLDGSPSARLRLVRVAIGLNGADWRMGGSASRLGERALAKALGCPVQLLGQVVEQHEGLKRLLMAWHLGVPVRQLVPNNSDEPSEEVTQAVCLPARHIRVPEGAAGPERRRHQLHANEVVREPGKGAHHILEKGRTITQRGLELALLEVRVDLAILEGDVQLDPLVGPASKRHTCGVGKFRCSDLSFAVRRDLAERGPGELRGEKNALEGALADIGAERQEAEDEELSAQLARLADLGQALRDAPPAIKRQVFESFELRIAYDKVERRVELTATVSEAVADAFENAKALQVEGSSVLATDIAGVGFEPTTSGL